MKEYFFTGEGVSSFHQASIVLVKGVKDSLNPIIERGISTDPDYNRLQYAQFIHDKDGTIFGVVGRLHVIYLALHRNEDPDWSKATYRTCYAYSDDPTGSKGSWVKPIIGRFLYNGNYDNNIIWETIATITHVPGAPYKLVGFHANGQRERIFGNDFNSLQTDGVSMMSLTHDAEQLFYSNGKIRFAFHVHYNLLLEAGGQEYIGRVWGINEATNLFPNVNDWVLDHSPGVDNAEATNTQDLLNYKVRIQDYRGNYEDEKYGVLPQNGVHNGGHMISGEDIHGEYVLFAPNFQTNDGDGILGRQNAYSQVGLLFTRNFVNDEVFTRIRGNEKDLLLSRSEVDWDKGWVSASGSSVIETDDEVYIFYEGWFPREEFISVPSVDIMEIGRASWRKDGFTKVSITPGGYFQTTPFPISGQLEVNHVGDIRVVQIRSGITITTVTVNGDNINAPLFDVVAGDVMQFYNDTAATVDVYSFGTPDEPKLYRLYNNCKIVAVSDGKLRQFQPVMDIDGVRYIDPVIKVKS